MKYSIAINKINKYKNEDGQSTWDIYFRKEDESLIKGMDDLAIAMFIESFLSYYESHVKLARLPQFEGNPTVEQITNGLGDHQKKCLRLLRMGGTNDDFNDVLAYSELASKIINEASEPVDFPIAGKKDGSLFSLRKTPSKQLKILTLKPILKSYFEREENWMMRFNGISMVLESQKKVHGVNVKLDYSQEISPEFSLEDQSDNLSRRISTDDVKSKVSYLLLTRVIHDNMTCRVSGDRMLLSDGLAALKSITTQLYKMFPKVEPEATPTSVKKKWQGKSLKP